MNKTEAVQGVTRSVKKFGLKMKKSSPEIFVIAGVVGVVVSAVMACRATMKIDSVLKEAEENKEKIQNYVESEGFTDAYSQEDYQRDLAMVRIQTGVSMAKLYAPSILLGAVSIASILSGHNILKKRNAAIGAAYAAVEKGFKDYRSRVIERFGEQVDKELKYNIQSKKFEETITDENGKEKKVKTTVEIADPDVYSEYARFFDSGCKGWEKDSEYNLMFLRSCQQYANDKLKADGYLFLNDVYDMLGIPRSKAGQIVGWVYDPKNPVGDNYVDFGIYDINREKNRDFVNGYERTILLDFNVDGNILDLI